VPDRSEQVRIGDIPLKPAVSARDAAASVLAEMLRLRPDDAVGAEIGATLAILAKRSGREKPLEDGEPDKPRLTWRIRVGGLLGRVDAQTGQLLYVADGWVDRGPHVPDTTAAARLDGVSVEVMPFRLLSLAHDASFVSPRVGYVVATDRKILKTTDGGQSFRQFDFDDPPALISVSAPSERVVFAAGGDARSDLGIIASTSDGGQTWNTKELGETVLRKVLFVDERRGWAFSTHASWATEDGGATWTKSAYDVTMRVAQPRDFMFVGGALLGVAARTLFTSTDGARSWRSRETGVDDLATRLLFATPDVGHVLTSHAGMFRTENGGVSWMKTAAKPHGPGDIAFANDRVGFVAAGPLWATTDGGNSWKSITAPRNVGRVSVVDFPTPTTGFALGRAVVRITLSK
jgi:photosystem II stability/assembly factor-like uncharacterized protein